MSFSFPDGFLWGAATSAYQVEGSPLADGAGPSIWHRFTRTPWLVPSGDNGDVACDHYRRYPEDVRLMRELGLNAYRFSVSWSRILPEGRGRVNDQGLDFYRRLVDALLEHGIWPLVTLYHWDLPAALDDRGGWLNPDVVHWFADYAQVMYRALDDRVEMWTTLNEPWVVTDGGYLHGALAPGHRNLFETPIASHHLLLGHAAAVEAYRAEGEHRIGLVVNIEPKYPASESAEDLAATRRAEAYMNRQYLDPVFHGRYPDEMKEVFGEAWPDFPAADLERIRQPIDFLGVNYYTRSVTRFDPTCLPLKASGVRQKRSAYTETSWEVYPQGLTDTLVWIKERYGNLPLYVTENGAAFYDPPTAEREVQDPLRVDYLRTHLRAAHQALEQGVDLRGYFAWSLFDNLEWSLGFSKRFGIVHVDFETLKRTPKASARFYSEVIRTGGGSLL
ncbi:MAG TPA: GH1 family beta-glucosidase [Thermoanaerobaculia bacterium]|jgi:beta-glucosidase|nr:GH1 family beta-glucosidase [Thermoanaerobaculia bacterium]